MIYIPNQALEFYVNKKVKESLYGVIAAVFLFVILSFGLYYKSSSTIIYSINLIVVGIICSCLIYSLTIMEGVKINKIVNEVIITNNIASFKTYSYKFLFYKIASQNFELSKDNIELQEIPFPFNSSGLSDNKTYCINLNGRNIYLCYECFSNNLLLELNAKGNAKN